MVCGFSKLLNFKLCVKYIANLCNYYFVINVIISTKIQEFKRRQVAKYYYDIFKL